MKKLERIHLSEPEWIIQCLFDLYTTSAIIMSEVSPEELHKFMYVDIALTIVRVIYFTHICLKLSRHHWWWYYIVPDQIMLAGLVAAVAYAFVVFSYTGESPDTYGAVSTTTFFVVLISFNAALRSVLVHMEWTRTRVVTYKVVRAYSVICYLIITLVHTTKELETYNPELFHFYCLMNLGYQEGMYGALSAFDKSAKGSLDFMIGESAKVETTEKTEKAIKSN